MYYSYTAGVVALSRFYFYQLYLRFHAKLGKLCNNPYKFIESVLCPIRFMFVNFHSVVCNNMIWKPVLKTVV
ncbi:hypothetical protein EII21_03610 [Conchiformibius steedae]|uniref:Uncharacterized protein n=1 Tax=Conchiformibius steedae TaxID=153493 RepID=A0A3P2A5G6_9NEIS|nr:hypothetical protein EII21_03610 [Conchiformibius steedae]